jgi:hypothetical protein
MPSLAIALVLGIALWVFWPRSEPSRSTQTGSAATSTTTALTPASANLSHAESERTPSSAPGASAAGRPSAPRRPSAEQQRLRERVVQSLRAREARGSSTAQTSAASGAPADAQDRAPREGTMKDKTGLMGDEVKVVNRELMPMVADCVDHAQERNPRLHGMLALGVKLASAEGVGTIFEAVEPGATNEVGDLELIDCIRQSAFTIELPKPKANRLNEWMMTIPVDAVSDAGSN